jgi:hypothetical protein
MKQAIVDFIRSEKIVTTCDRIMSFNLYSCTVADTVFESPFEIKATEDTTVTTLVGYFDVHFNLEHAVHFSTGPSSPPTHWKQTLFQIHEPISLKKGKRCFIFSFGQKYERKCNLIRYLSLQMKRSMESYNAREIAKIADLSK